jgi:hypothetical protein
VSLIAAAALALFLGMAAYATYIGLSVVKLSSVRAAQDDLLTEADAVVRAYAAVYGRYPCPAAQRGGDADCGPAGSRRQKGWFPRNVARQFAARGQLDSMIGLRYMAFRGEDGGDGLAGSKDIFPIPNYGNVSNGHDLCRTLVMFHQSQDRAESGLPDDGRSTSADTAFANVPTDRPGAGGASVINVAFGLAAPGASGFTGANADDLPHMESPAREPSTTYTERVLISDFRSAARTHACGGIINGLNTLTRADEWTKAVPPARDSATAHFTESTIIPLTLSALFWEGQAANHFQKQLKNREKIIEGINESVVKDTVLCIFFPIPYCITAIAQGVKGVEAMVQLAGSSGEILIIQQRLVRYTLDMALAAERQARYQNLDIWTDSGSVLEKADRQGVHMEVLP